MSIRKIEGLFIHIFKCYYGGGGLQKERISIRKIYGRLNNFTEEFSKGVFFPGRGG